MDISIERYNNEHTGLAWEFCVSPDSCNNPEYYEEYLRCCALSDRTSGHGITYVLLEKDGDRNKAIAGYVSVRAASLISKDENGRSIGAPALEIAELAVSKDYKGNGYGKALVNKAIVLADELRRDYLSIKHIVLYSDPSSIDFYKKNGFVEVGDLYEIPHENWNADCEPMYLTLPDI